MWYTRHELTPVEGEAIVLLSVVPELLHPAGAGSDLLGQGAGILAGLAGELALLAGEEAVAVALLALVVELLTGARLRVVGPPTHDDNLRRI